MNDFCNVKKCDIELGDITLLSGCNNSGKSLACKVFYSMLGYLSMLEDKQVDLFDLQSSVFTEFLYKALGNKASGSISVFDEKCGGKTTLSLSKGNATSFYTDLKNFGDVMCVSGASIDTLFSDCVLKPQDSQLRDVLRHCIISQDKKQSTVLNDVLNGRIPGELSMENSRVVYRHEGVEIGIDCVPKSLQLFLILKTFARCKVFNGLGYFIIDDIDNLNPEWQVMYAECLVLLKKHFKAKFLVVSNSIYFIDAIDLFSKKYGISSVTHHFVKGDKEGSTISKCAIEDVFRSLATPIQTLDSLRHELNNEVM